MFLKSIQRSATFRDLCSFTQVLKITFTLITIFYRSTFNTRIFECKPLNIDKVFFTQNIRKLVLSINIPEIDLGITTCDSCYSSVDPYDQFRFHKSIQVKIRSNAFSYKDEYPCPYLIFLRIYQLNFFHKKFRD